jgi:KUP system potassium uptake protein
MVSDAAIGGTVTGPAKRARRHGTARGALELGALGVVFGDIGTSPLYTVQTVFSPSDPHRVRVSTENVYGVISLIFWAVVTIVMITYVLLIMRADNDGEGGIMALITLIRRNAPSGRRAAVVLALLGIFGASLFFGDSMITPAISVLSAIEGVQVAAPSVGSIVLPITAVILIGLFMIQRLGTSAVGRLFGPVMAVWFAVIAAWGIRGVVSNPSILKALSPTYAASFLFGHFGTAFFSLAAVVLAVTGAEALYADMGHFGRAPITRAWIFLVFPACILNYLGQGALVLSDPATALSNPFFLLVSSWARIPMVILAAAATVIASQAVISGAFSVTQQAAQIGYLPRLRIDHTSEERMGQIYVPWINWALCVAVLALVFTFRTSTALAYAYGVAVTGTITISTLLFFYIVRSQWKKPLWLVVPGAVVLLTVDLLFFSANLTKLPHGAWLPLAIGILVFTVLTTWQKGRQMVSRQRALDEGSLREFIDRIHTKKPRLPRVPGTAIFLNRGKATAPLAMRANVEHNHVLHDQVIILSIETLPVPHVEQPARLEVDDLGYKDDRIYHVAARFGYMDAPSVPSLLPLIRDACAEGPLDAEGVSYFLSTIEVRKGNTPGLSRWRKRLFIATTRLTADAAEYFNLPRNRTVIMGARIEL